LVRHLAGFAREKGCASLFLVTTNDNTNALRFYQKLGFHMRALHPDIISEYRKIKPEIPLKGEDGIPICDEIELEMDL
jgi:ribosomal protein S18 acetylase RimI-like enzyme